MSLSASNSIAPISQLNVQFPLRFSPEFLKGDRESLTHIRQTVADNFGLKLDAGRSFLGEIL